MGAEQFLDGRIVLHQGDCLDVLATLDENSAAACITDPPYHLTANKRGGTGLASLNPDSPAGRARISTGFMGRAWDGGDVAFNPETWRAVYRVLKPGAHLLAFGGTRTYHRMACAIEDAGFEIRDCVMWTYGSGFPKSHDVSKAIDRAAGVERDDLGPNPSKIGRTRDMRGGRLIGQGETDMQAIVRLTAPATAEAAAWSGWGTALKPAVELIALARKPLSEKTIAANVLRWGTGALNIDACRIPTSAEDQAYISERINGFNDTQSIGGNAAYRGGEKMNRGAAYDASKGRWPANLCHDGSEEVVAAFPDGRSAGDYPSDSSTENQIYGKRQGQQGALYDDAGSAARFFASFPQEDTCLSTNSANGADNCLLQCHQPNGGFAQPSVQDSRVIKIAKNVKYAASLCDSCAIVIAQSIAATQRGQDPEGVLSRASISEPNKRILHQHLALYVAGRENTDIITTTESLKILLGSVSHAIGAAISLARSVDAESTGQDLKRLHYTSKADASDRLGSKHPTVKPLDLMQWLVRLITPKGGLVLDPFAGTGTTAEAAFREGMLTLLIERDAEYCDDIRRRMAAVLAGPVERRHLIIKARDKHKPPDYGPLFEGLDK